MPILWAFICILFVSSPALCDLTVSVSGGDSSSEMTSSVTYDKGTLSASQDLKVDPGKSIGNDFYFRGSLASKSTSGIDSAGNYVYLKRSVSGGPRTRGSWYWRIYSSSGQMNGYMRMNAYNAYNIYGYSHAANKAGAHSKSYTNVYGSSSTNTLHDYYTSAYATSSKAYTHQDFSYAKGDVIKSKTYAYNGEGDYASSYDYISKGQAYSYSAYAYSYWYKAYARCNDLIIDVPNGYGYLTMYASKRDKTYPSSYKDITYSQQYIKYGDLQTDCPTAGYSDYAYASRYYDKAYAYSSADFYRYYSGYGYSRGYGYNPPGDRYRDYAIKYVPSGASKYQARGYVSGWSYDSAYAGSC